MILHEWFPAFLAVVSSHPLLERLFFASLELALLALALAAAIRAFRIRSPRVAALLWLLVLAKPVASLVIGNPLHVVQLEVPAPAEIAATDSSDTPAPEEVAVADEADPEGREAPSELAANVRLRPRDSTVPLEQTGIEENVEIEPAAEPEMPVEAVRTAATSVVAGDQSTRIRNVGRLALGVWGAGVAIFVLLSLVDRIRRRRLIAAGRTPGPELAARYAAVGASLGAKQLPRLLITDELESPALVGALPPVVLIPSWLADEGGQAPRSSGFDGVSGTGDGASPRASTGGQTRLDWSLRHELMHWKLCDPPANFVREVAQILFYFHPAAWWAGRKWEESAELACDRAIIRSEADSLDYAEQLYGMLVEIRDRHRLPLRGGLFATRTQIGRRIAALFGGSLKARPHLSALMLAGVALLSVVTLCIGGAFSERAAEPGDEAAGAAATTDDVATKAGEPRAAAEPVIGELRLVDETVIKGKLLPASAPGRLRWKEEGPAEAKEFELKEVAALQLAADEAPAKAPGNLGFEISGGDLLHGSLIGLTADSIEFDASQLGRVTLKRDRLRQIFRPREGEGMLYVGPHRLADWTVGGRADAWHEVAGDLVTEQMGSLYCDFGLPPRAWIDVEFAWTKKPDFVFALGVDASDKSPSQAFRIEAWNRDFVLLRETDREADVATIESITATTDRVRLQLFLDQEVGRCIILSEGGKQLADLKIAARMPKTLPGLRLTNKRGDVRLERLRIGPWNGIEPLPIGKRTSRVLLHDGSFVNGELTGFEDKTNEYIVRLGDSESRIPDARIAAIFLPSVDDPKPADAPSQLVTVVSRDGTRLNGIQPRFEEQSLNLFSPLVGKRVSLPWPGVRALVVRHPAKPSAAAAEAPPPRGAMPAVGDVAEFAVAPADVDETTIFRGRVVDPEGKPVPGATLYAVVPNIALVPGVSSDSKVLRRLPVADSKSSPDGSFELALRKSVLESATWGAGGAQGGLTIAAFRTGFGPAWKLASDLMPGENVALQLARDDVPVKGRLIDLEGRPLAGVKVSVLRLRAPREGDLTPWLEAIAAGEPRNAAISRLMTILPDCDSETIPPATTDAQGRFRITGIGRERYAELAVQGANVAYTDISVVTRPIAPTVMQEFRGPGSPPPGANPAMPARGASPQQPRQGPASNEPGPRSGAPSPPAGATPQPATAPNSPRAGFSTAIPPAGAGMPGAPIATRPLRGADFDFVVQRSRPVTGTIRDANSRAPLAGVRVINRQFAGAPRADLPRIEAISDAAGRFSLVGMPLGKGNVVAIVPTGERPYFGQLVDIAVDAGLEPIPVDVELHEGIWIIGRVTDKATGAPVAATVDWYPYFSNEFARERTPEFEARTKRYLSEFRSLPDGAFKVVGLPGRAVVAAVATGANAQSFRIGAGSETLEVTPTSPRMPAGLLPQDTWQQVSGGLLVQRQPHGLKGVNIPEGVAVFTCNLELDSGETLSVLVVDPEGKPLTDFGVRGQEASIGTGGIRLARLRESTFEVRGLAAGEPRAVYVQHLEKELGKAVLVEVGPDKPRNVTIKLEPCATITGRVVNREGGPLTDEILSVIAVARWKGEARIGGMGIQSASRVAERGADVLPIDKEGRFRLMVPTGCDYSLSCGIVLPATGGGVQRQVMQTLSANATPKPGETIDLGDLRLPPLP